MTDAEKEVFIQRELAYSKGYEKGRKDAIDECIKAVRNHHPDIVKMLEQIKEQKNESYSGES